MAYKPYNPYSSDKEPTILRFLPFILFGGIALGMSLVGYDGYKHAHPKPKPVAAEPAVIPYTKLTAATISCNDGVMVTDWRDCQEYESPVHAVVEDDAFITISPQRPRKHKRLYSYYPADKSWARGPWDQWNFINTIPMMISCSKLSSASAGTCESRPLTPEEIDRYKPVTDIVDLRKQALADPSDEGCYGCDRGPTPNNDGPCPPDCKPDDITNLMEQIVPTPTLHRHEPDCKMPADIDVCPAQTLDPKARHD